MHNSIELLLKYRKKMGISSKNPYVFGLPSSNLKRHRFLRATVLMRKFSKDCGAEKPSTLRGTFLRKHIATKCADMEMNETEISRVANFMGYHVDIHKNIYKQPVAKVDILSMSKVLEKVQKHKNSSESSTDTSKQNDSELNSSKNNIETNNIDDSMNSSRKGTDSSLISSSDNEKVLRRNRKRSSGLKSELQKSKKLKEMDTSTDNYQDSSFELPHLRKRKRLNADKAYAEIKNKSIKRRWTKEEIRSAGCYFDDYIENGILPSLPKIKEIQRDYNVLQSRTPAVVKTWLHNQIRNAKKLKNTSASVKKVRTRKSSSNDNWKKHMAYIFTSHLSKCHVPSIRECQKVIKGNKTLTEISPKKIQNYVIQMIQDNTP